MTDRADEMRLKYPIGQKFSVHGFQLQFTKRYARNRFKVNLLEKCKMDVDFEGQEFTIQYDRFKFKGRKGNSYIVTQLESEL